MKRNVFVSAMMAFAAVCGGNVNAANPPYVLTANSDGTFTMSGDDYVDKIAMTEVSPGMYEVKDVDIEYGFAFLGESSSSSSVYSLYSLPEWAVAPAIISWYNPLSISMGANSLIDVTPGKYDVVFLDRNQSGMGYHMFKLIPMDHVGAAEYPRSMFLVSNQTANVEVPGNAGVYESDVTLPSSFRVSYEPRYDMAMFIFGPASASANLLSNNVPLSLAYTENSTVNLGYSQDATSGNVLAPGMMCHVKIDITGTEPSISVTIPGTSAISGIESDNGGVSVLVNGGVVSVSGAEGMRKGLYNVSGVPVYEGIADEFGPYARGLYMLRVGDTVRKVMVR